MTDREPLRAITAGEIDAFQRDGFAVLPAVLSRRWLEPLAGACERILASPHPDTRDVTVDAVRLAAQRNPAALFRGTPYAVTLAERGHFIVSGNTARREPVVRDFVLRGAIGGIAAALLRSTTARFLDDVLLVKEPRSDEETEWHDDQPFSPATGTQRCAVWVSLDDVTEESGALRYLRGSHDRFVGWRERGSDAAALAAEHAQDVVVCPVQRGDVVAHYAWTVHAAGPNRSERRRRAFSLRFAGDDARFVLPAAHGEPRAWYGLEDGEPLGGDRFPLAWPRQSP
jgi:hypothetical protein